MSNQEKNQECCQKFDPLPWNEAIFEWKEKKFIKSKVRTFFYMPINFGSIMTRLVNKIAASSSGIVEGLILSEHSSSWSMNLYLAVDREIDGENNILISGKYISKVYEGKFKDVGLWLKDFNNYLQNKNLISKNNFFWYTTCPKCAKKYGKNYVVIIGQIS